MVQDHLLLSEDPSSVSSTHIVAHHHPRTDTLSSDLCGHQTHRVHKHMHRQNTNTHKRPIKVYYLEAYWIYRINDSGFRNGASQFFQWNNIASILPYTKLITKQITYQTTNKKKIACQTYHCIYQQWFFHQCWRPNLGARPRQNPSPTLYIK